MFAGIRYKILAFHLLLGIISATEGPGATMSIDIAIVEQAKNVYFDFVMNIINNLTIPEIDFDGGYIKENEIHITETSKNVNISTDVADNGFEFRVDDLKAKFHSGQFKMKKLLITAKGSIDVSMDEIDVDIKIGVRTAKLPNGRYVPFLTVPRAKVDINRKKMDIKIHGNFVTKIAKAFKWMFKGLICNKIEDAIEDAIK